MMFRQAIILTKVLRKKYYFLTQKRNIKFPDDEKAHETQLEWWYFNAHLQDKHYNNYSLMGVISNDGGSSTVLFDEQNKKYYSESAHAKFDKEKISTKNFSWENLGKNTFLVKSENPKFSFTIKANKNPMLVNKTGLIDLKTGYAYYYSFTNCEIKGSIIFEDQELNLEGKAWVDRQWGDMNLSLSIKYWEWFSIQLNNGVEVMAYKIKYKNNKEEFVLHIIRENLEVLEGKVEHLKEWTDNKNREWSTKWVLKGQGLELTGSLDLRNQFIAENVLEAAGKVKGKLRGEDVQGKMFFEKIYP